MSMQGDVKGATCAAGATTAVFAGRTRLKGFSVSATTAGATVAIKDDTTTLFTYTATVAGAANILIPGEGVLIATTLNVTTAAGVSAIAFYG